MQRPRERGSYLRKEPVLAGIFPVQWLRPNYREKGGQCQGDGREGRPMFLEADEPAFIAAAILGRPSGHGIVP